MTSHNSIFRRHCLILFLFSALLMLPAALFGSGGFDMLVNCMKVRLFSAQFWHGDLYPRWLMDQFAGNGSPIFFYYPPLAYFITALFIFLAPLDPFGYYPLAASVWLAAFIAGVTFYLWMKDEVQESKAALIGSLLYMSAPAIIGWQFYYLALFHSIWGWAWAPLLMLYARKIMQRRPYGAVGYALALAALIMTSIPMTILFGPLSVAYGALYMRRSELLQQGATLGASVLLGFALTAILLIPAAAYLDYSNAKLMWGADKADYHKFFIGLTFKYLSEKVWTFVVLIMTVLTLIYSIALRSDPGKYLLFMIASLIGVFMMIHASVRVWEVIPVLKTLQMPWRFVMVPSFCLPVLASVAYPRLRSLAYGLIVFYTACTYITSHLDARVTEAGLRKYNHLVYEEYVLNLDFGAFLPSADLFPQYSPGALSALDHPHIKAETVRGDAVTEVTEWRPRHIALHYKATKQSIIRIGQFYFPGTVAFEGTTLPETGRDEQTGQILVVVQPGQGDVRVELTQLMPEIAGEIISLLTAVILFLWFLVEFRRQHQR